jgi:ubiquinone/menaquinone biosynthesis C-methylase UbiE
MSEILRATAGADSHEPALAHRRRHWDRRSATYDCDFVQAPIRVRVLDEIFRDLPHNRLAALDAGTGTGRTLARLVAHVAPGSQIVGSDLSDGMLAQARSTVTPRYDVQLNFVKADNADLPFRTGTFDLIVSTFTLHHVPPSQQLTVLTEFRRLLADDGSLILADQIQPEPALGPESMRDAVARTFYPHLGREEALSRLSKFGEWPLQAEELRSILLSAGFASEITVLDPIVAVAHARPFGRRQAQP